MITLMVMIMMMLALFLLVLVLWKKRMMHGVVYRHVFCCGELSDLLMMMRERARVLVSTLFFHVLCRASDNMPVLFLLLVLVLAY